MMINLYLNNDEGSANADPSASSESPSADPSASSGTDSAGKSVPGEEGKYLENMKKFPTKLSKDDLTKDFAVISLQIERLRKTLQNSHRNNTKLKHTIERVKHDKTVTIAEKQKVQQNYNRQKAVITV